MFVQSFKDLVVWQKGMKLVNEVYCIADKLPEKEKFGLTSQICRSCVSIPSNIAEGKKRRTRKDYIHYLYVADGSAGELETQLMIIENQYSSIDVQKAKLLVEEIQKMLSVLVSKLRNVNLDNRSRECEVN